MAQRKEITVEQVLKLVEQLTPEEQGRLIEHIKLQELRREIMVGIEQARAGQLVDGEEAFAKLEERYRSEK